MWRRYHCGREWPGAVPRATRAAVAPFPRTLRDNPYCDLLYRALAGAGVRIEDAAELSPSWIWRERRRVAVLHLHWPEFYYRGPKGAVTARDLAAFVFDVLLALALGYRVVWTVHNQLPHEAQKVDRFIYWFLRRTAQTVTHCEAARALLGPARREPAVIPHGHYIGWYPDTLQREEARTRLGLQRGEKVLLCFGQLRAYKGVEDLLRAFQRVSDPKLRLVVAGRPASDADARLLGELVSSLGDERVQLHPRYVPDDEVQVFFRACDLVVLPYRSVLTSGAAMLALSFGRPLIVPRLGCLKELASQGCALDYEPEAPGALEEAIRIAARVDATLLGQRARKTAEGLGWERIARAYMRVYGLRGSVRDDSAEPTRRVSA